MPDLIQLAAAAGSGAVVTLMAAARAARKRSRGDSLKWIPPQWLQDAFSGIDRRFTDLQNLLDQNLLTMNTRLSEQNLQVASATNRISVLESARDSIERDLRQVRGVANEAARQSENLDARIIDLEGWRARMERRG